MCDTPCIFVYDCNYFTNICTIISLLYVILIIYTYNKINVLTALYIVNILDTF
jgi:hypothetical protein